jgi:hypothetical protein
MDKGNDNRMLVDGFALVRGATQPVSSKQEAGKVGARDSSKVATSVATATAPEIGPSQHSPNTTIRRL